VAKNKSAAKASEGKKSEGKKSASKRKHAPFAWQQNAHKRTGRPIVAIVGRPNVGKSALFNRLTRSRIAIVEDIAGVTRDRLYADADAFGLSYVLVDTGGFDPESEDPMTQGIALQVQVALEEADAVICVMDGSLPPLPADREAVSLLRRSQLPVIYVANKIDNANAGHVSNDLYRLGIDELLEVSALHGHGVGDLEERLVKVLPRREPEEETPEEGRPPRIAIIGRPNAGKSSLVNRLLGEQRQLVDDRPGTTVDAVDALYHPEGSDPLILVDTAGIRRKRSVDRGLEMLAVMQAINAIERSHTVILMIDATAGASEQDTKIAGLALDRGRAIVIALNKMDALDGEGREKAILQARELFSFAPWAPIARVSVKSGRGVTSLITTAREVTTNHRKRIATGELNRFFEEVLERHPPPTQSGKAIRLYFVTQAMVAPPTFVVSTNFPDNVHWSYQRYVSNQIRERFGFEGTPLRVHYRPKNKKERDE
jgi:GTP-binding protein